MAAYKGIPLAVACVLALEQLYGHDAGYLFDRKEAKLHGEHSASPAADASDEARKRLVGQLPDAGARVVLLDDVLTTGGTKHEALELLRRAVPGVALEALVIALDRQEAGPDGRTATAAFSAATSIPVHAVLTARELTGALRSLGHQQAAERMLQYLQEHGVAG
jgi:orotate phosphoribosyltransferase